MHNKVIAGEQHVRMNCTVRWHDPHWEKCPRHNKGVEGVCGTQSVLTEAVRTPGEMAAPAAARTAAAQPVRRVAGSCVRQVDRMLEASAPSA